MKVTAILKGMIDQNGHQPIQIRIADGDKRHFKSTGIKVSPDLFENGRVSKKHPKAKEFNQQLETKIIQYQAQALDGFKKKKTKVDFYAYTNNAIAGMQRAAGSFRQYQSQISKLKTFAPTLAMTEINKDWLNAYREYLRSIGNSENTIWAAFKFLKTFIQKAWKEEVIEKNPFLNYEFPKYQEPDKLYLTEAEIKAFDKVTRSKDLSYNLKQSGIWFLIACDTGMRISDIEKFDANKHIVGGRLVFRTEKTKELVGLPIDDHLRKLFERVEYKRLSINRNYYNELIKIVATAAGIEKHITSHTARHTAAMSLANKGISEEVTAKILGHRDRRATSTYYKITNQRIDMELKKRRK